MTALLSLAIVAWVLLMGSAADLDDPYARTAFALGILTAVPAFLAVDLGERRR